MDRVLFEKVALRLFEAILFSYLTSSITALSKEPTLTSRVFANDLLSRLAIGLTHELCLQWISADGVSLRDLWLLPIYVQSDIITPIRL